MNHVTKIIKKNAPLLALNIVLSTIATLLALLGPLMVGRAIDAIPSYAVPYGEFWRNCALLAAAYAGAALATYLFTIFSYNFSQAVTNDLRKAIFSKLYRVPIKTIDNTPFGQVLSFILNDAENVAEGVFQLVTTLFGGIITAVGTIYIMISLNWQIGLMIMLVTPVSVGLSAVLTRISRKHFRVHQANMAALNTTATENFSNQKLLMLNNDRDQGSAAFDDVNAALLRSYQDSMFISALPNPLSRVVNYIAYALTGMMGLILGVPVGHISSLLLYANQFNKPFNDFTSVVTQLQAASASLRRIREFLDKDEQIETQHPVPADLSGGEIELKHVSFSYDGNPFLRDLSLEIDSGRRIAIVGPTGAGKTTLINLIMRFYEPDAGEILFDGTNIESITRRTLREHIGMVLQDSFLSRGTVADNIDYGRNLTRDQIIDAAKRARCHTFIETLRDGYDTMIDDAGSFSEGQKQLICIARVMAQLPPVLLLDEATSNIDTRTEKLVQRAFADMMKGRTSFVIAHRLQTIKDADHILVVKDGNIIEQGTHDELMAGETFYRTLYKSQYEVA